MKFEQVKTLNFEMAKSNFLILEQLIDDMSDEDFLKIPEQEMTNLELNIIERFAWCFIPARWYDLRPNRNLYSTGSYFFKVKIIE